MKKIVLLMILCMANLAAALEYEEESVTILTDDEQQFEAAKQDVQEYNEAQAARESVQNDPVKVGSTLWIITIANFIIAIIALIISVNNRR